jgi:hypothetical protein
MFSWLSNKIGLTKNSKQNSKKPSPEINKPKSVSIFDSISYLSPEGENSSPINTIPKQKQKKLRPKSWSKTLRNANQKSITMAANRSRYDVNTTLGLHKQKDLTPLTNIKPNTKPINKTKSILKNKINGGNKTKKKCNKS